MSHLVQLTPSFRPRQVNNIKEAFARIGLVVKCLNPNLEHVVTPARCLVDSVEFKDPLLLRHHDDVHELVWIVHWHPNLSGTKYLAFVALDLQILVVTARK